MDETYKKLLNLRDFLRTAPKNEAKFMGVPIDEFTRDELIAIFKYLAWKDIELSYRG